MKLELPIEMHKKAAPSDPQAELAIITKEILGKLRGRWDEMNDYDGVGGSGYPARWIFSFGRDTDPSPMSPADVVKAADTIRSVLSKHRLHIQGGIRIYAHGKKITFHAEAEK